MRQCGACQLCCKLLPVPQVPKLAGERCPHQKFGVGCSIYARRPPSCRLWSCAWLVTDTGLRRPDRSHYVVDIMRDFIEANDGHGTVKVPVIQVWIDPAFPHAHRDPALRRYIQARAEIEGCAALVRPLGLVLMPPALMTTGRWVEKWSQSSGRDHTAAEIDAALNGVEDGA